MDSPIYVAPSFWTRRKITGLVFAAAFSALAALASFEVPQFQAAANARLDELAANLHERKTASCVFQEAASGVNSRENAFALLLHAKGLLALSNEGLNPNTISDRLAWAYADEATRNRTCAAIQDAVFVADRLTQEAKAIFELDRNGERQRFTSSGFKI